MEENQVKKIVLILFMCVISPLEAAQGQRKRVVSKAQPRSSSMTVYNKSHEQIAVSVGQTKSAEKSLIKPRQSKKFMVPPLTQMQPYHIAIESGSLYWPSAFEVAMMAPNQIILRRDSLVLSRKTLGVRTTAKKPCVVRPASPIKIAYNGKSSITGQEIMFMT